jgi:putative polyketide hydroxylase
MTDIHTPVLVVGGGVTGLSSAVFLAWHGVPCTLVERHPDLLIHPRARGLTPRTMELFRQVDLEATLNAAAYAGSEFAWVPVRADTLSAAHTLAQEPSEDDGASASPCGFGPIDQDKVEIALRDKARALGADIRFSTEMTSFTQDGSGVTATLNDRATGNEHTVQAEYLIAADGSSSPIRASLGIGADGPGPLYDTIAVIVDADLRPALRGRPATIAYLQQPRPFTVLMAHDQEGLRWVFGTGYDPREESVADYTDARVVEMVRAAAGLPGVKVTLRPQIPGTDRTVLGFPIAARVAQRYQQGRVFLVGDAAHAVPPTGGLGANTGIQDAHNLAWKLAGVVKGQAGPALLDTYHDERHPTGLLTMQQALARFGTRMGPEGGPQIVDYAAVALGYQYRSSAVPGPTDPGARPLLPHELRGQPGTRAPHVPVVHNGAGISTLDLYGRGLVLLTGAAGTAWVHAATARDVAAYRFGVDLIADGSDSATAAHGISDEGALLVRPDGFVAWRSADPAADSANSANSAGDAASGRAIDPSAELDRALGAILSRAR